MLMDDSIRPEERTYLRELARKQAEYAALPIMQERIKRWYAHNALRGERPMVVMEMDTFEDEMLPPSRCTSPAAVWLEYVLQRQIVHHEWIGDDVVVPDFISVPMQIHIDPFGVEIPVEHVDDGLGKQVGYRFVHPIKDLRRDFHLLQPGKYWFDREETKARQTFVEDVLGDLLRVVVENHSFAWYTMLTEKTVRLMGLEAMMMAMVDDPESLHALFAYLRDNVIRFARWQEEEGLLTLNNGNHYAGAGSYGFTHELPKQPPAENGRVRTSDLWVNMNSQESVGISPRMYHQFIFPYYRDIAELYGMVYYGCCEPVHTVWEKSVSQLPNLRKVSISPWCDEDYMGEVLRGSGVMYSRKPSPNFIGVGKVFDEEAFRAHIQKTLRAARGCALEIIFRDVYTLTGDRTKPRRAVEITRECIEEMWK